MNPTKRKRGSSDEQGKTVSMLPPGRFYPNDDNLDLVYPFDESNGGGGGGGGSSVPITVDPSGPLHLSDQNVLSLRLGVPLSSQGRKLVLDLAGAGPLYIGSDGTLGLQLRAPFMLRTGALALNIDSNIMRINDNSQLSISTMPPLKQTSTGISLSTNNSLQVTDSNLGIALANNSGLRLAPDGIKIDVDNETIEIKSGMLAVKNSPTYISPYKIMEIGNKSLTDNSGQICGSAGSDQTTCIWNINYYLYLVSCSKIVNGFIMIKLDASRVSTIPSTNSNNTGINFSFVVSPLATKNRLTNISYITNVTTTPTNSENSFLPEILGSSYVSIPNIDELHTRFVKWYKPISTSCMTLVPYSPAAAGSEFTDTICGYLPIHITQTNSIIANAMLFTFNNTQTSGSNWFESHGSNDSLATGFIPFSYKSTNA